MFLRSFVFMTLLIALSQLLANDFGDIIWGRSVFLPALLFTVILVLIQVIAASYAGVKEDYSPRQIQNIDGQVDFKILALEIRKNTKWVLEIENSTTLRYRSGFDTLRSFGETIIIENEENQIRITSKPVVKSTLFDYGKNFQNMEIIKNIITRLQQV